MVKYVNIEEILGISSRLEKAEQTADICHNVRFTPNSVRTVRVSADRIKESAKSETNVFV